MLAEEFEKQQQRVNRYSQLTKYKDQLNKDESWILNGILNITTAYQHEIRFTYNDELKDKIIKAIYGVYDDEVDIINKQLDVL